MSSPSQKHGSCGHIMASFDSHNFCARCREKGKGTDPCINKNDCNSCNLLTEEQCLQLSTPSYRLKKEKRDLKKSDTPKQDSSSSSLIDPYSVTVVGAVDAQGILQSPGSSSGKAQKTDSSSKPKDLKPKAEKPSKSSPKSHKSSVDSKIDDLDQKWADRFNRLEALLLAKTLDKPDPAFTSVKVAPTHSPPASSAISDKPFIRPSGSASGTDASGTDLAFQSQVTDQSVRPDTLQHTSDLTGSLQTVSKSTSKSQKNRASTDRLSDRAGTASPVPQQVPSRSSSAPARRLSTSSMDTDTDLSDRPPVDIFVEEGELSDQELESATADPDQTLSEEQTYRETMSGIRSFMGWTHIPEVDTAASTADDNPFAGPKSQPSGKVSVSMPTDEWLCSKMGKLNLTLTEGYPSRSSEAGGLLKDQFVRPPRSQAKWYSLASNQEKPGQDTGKTVSAWSTDASKINSTYSRIAKAAGIASTPPASRQISQDNLRRWEKSAREASTICNQAAAFNRCLYKVQDSMQSQLKVIKADFSKGKSSSKVSQAADELQFLMNFNSSITQSMAKTLEHLTDFVFVTVANTTLARRETLICLTSSWELNRTPLLPCVQDHYIFLHCSQIQHLSRQNRISPTSKARDNPSLGRKVAFTLMSVRTSVQISESQTALLGRILGTGDSTREARPKPPTTHRDQPRASSPINDNHCVKGLQEGLLAGSKTVSQELLTDSVNYGVVKVVHSAPGPSQRKEVSPGLAACQKSKSHKLKYVNSASCVISLSCVQSVPNVPNAVQNPPVGARLQNFWQTWLGRGASPTVVQILREGYTLPFRTRPNLTRFPTVVSCYVNPHRNSYLLEALHQLMDKHAIELVRNQTSLGFFNRLFLVPKPNNKWRPILDLSNLNIFLKVEKFKMETPETIRTSLQKQEWVTSVDFKDAYFHIPIQEQSRKYLRFHIQGQTYQFKALPFGLSTAPMEFTVLAKEVKLMAMHKGIRIHQYLDDWLVRAGSQQVCLHHTQILVKMFQELGWLVNMEKSELEPKQIFDFVGYQFDLRAGRVRPTMDR